MTVAAPYFFELTFEFTFVDFEESIDSDDLSVDADPRDREPVSIADGRPKSKRAKAK